ncbi:TIGR01841 family phasin [Roseomonas sp. OT10]|uniref:phasin family protein n=1 Tax=Roseomonas cutis TaxID=2897332 RepID=UPI001E2CEEB4|nr:TIGR01841 family phasin [Roseomonas sp. OT10]UFN51163.1 TIGR01841 family phasin [Roseomonas sp. OT10]
MANEKVARLANDAVAQGTQAAEAGTAQFKKIADEGMAQANKAAESMYKVTEEAMAFGRGNVEALAKAAQTYLTGSQDLSKQAFAVMQSLSEQAIENAKALAAVKSIKEAADLQTSFARTAMEKLVSETAKLQEAGFRLAEQTAAPIAQRVTLAVERASKPIAA